MSNNNEKNNNDMYVHKFKKTFEYEGKTYQTIDFNFGKLIGSDMIAVETEMQDKGYFAVSPEYSRVYQCYIAAKAANIGSDVMEAMPFSEFNRITTATRNFLLSTGF